MKVKFESKFIRDVQKLKDARLATKIKEIINDCKVAQNLNDLNQLKKLKGYKNYYRMRLGDHRIGLELVDDEIVFVRCLHQREIYQFFP
jgi:mRNA interferase RelE/StbE